MGLAEACAAPSLSADRFNASSYGVRYSVWEPTGRVSDLAVLSRSTSAALADADVMGLTNEVRASSYSAALAPLAIVPLALAAIILLVWPCLWISRCCAHRCCA